MPPSWDQRGSYAMPLYTQNELQHRPATMPRPAVTESAMHAEDSGLVEAIHAGPESDAPRLIPPIGWQTGATRCRDAGRLDAGARIAG